MSWSNKQLSGDSFTNKLKPNNDYKSIPSFLLQDEGYLTINDSGDRFIINLGGMGKPFNTFTNKTI